MTRLDPAFLEIPLAHRGLHDKSKGRIENSMPAIDAALAHGYGIEIDIQVSQDGVPMVFHDPTLERLTPLEGSIRALPADALTSVALSGGNGATIPTLDAVLARVGGRVPLVVEVKDQDGALGADIGNLAKAVATRLARYRGVVAAMSFNPHMVTAMAEAAPDLAIGRVTGPFKKQNWQNVSDSRRAELAALDGLANLDFISHDRSDLARLAGMKKRGLPVLCWTIRSTAEEAEARQFADNITFEGYLPSGPSPKEG